MNVPPMFLLLPSGGYSPHPVSIPCIQLISSATPARYPPTNRPPHNHSNAISNHNHTTTICNRYDSRNQPSLHSDAIVNRYDGMYICQRVYRSSTHNYILKHTSHTRTPLSRHTNTHTDSLNNALNISTSHQ